MYDVSLLPFKKLLFAFSFVNALFKQLIGGNKGFFFLYLFLSFCDENLLILNLFYPYWTGNNVELCGFCGLVTLFSRPYSIVESSFSS